MLIVNTPDKTKKTPQMVVFFYCVSEVQAHFASI